MNEPWDYKRAGLDLERYAETMAGIQPLLARTWDQSRVLPPPFPPRKGGKGSGGFASLFDINPDGRYRRPILVSCTDGVGSKLKIAAMMQKYDTVGIDLVAMSVNDLICTGGEPLVFLDYLAMPADDTVLTQALVAGISAGCLQAGCSLVGGETAILPEFYAPGDFDMAGFCSGVVEHERIIDGTAIRPGDVLVGVASSGIHSNGYSLARKLVFEAGQLTIDSYVPELQQTAGEALLVPTRIYVREVRALLEKLPHGAVSGLANITGGGLPDNLARILPEGAQAVLQRGSWPAQAVFTWMQQLGNVAQAEMDRVFNCGIGFVVVCRADHAEAVRTHFAEAWVIGEVQAATTGVTWRTE